MRVLVFDPAGNHHEGKGITGFTFMKNGIIHEVGTIKSTDYESAAKYWLAHKYMIQAYKPETVVLEKFQLYPQLAKHQYWSEFETSQLIGVITVTCYELDIPLYKQSASEAKRWTNDKLVDHGVIDKKGKSFYWRQQLLNKTQGHELDAIRHSVQFLSKHTRKSG